MMVPPKVFDQKMSLACSVASIGFSFAPMVVDAEFIIVQLPRRSARRQGEK